jgi:ABC-type multidrug transport system ATPase subunit
MLTGQLRPSEGRALLLGLDVSKYPNQVQAQIGVAFETTNLYEQMTGGRESDAVRAALWCKEF